MTKKQFNVILFIQRNQTVFTCLKSQIVITFITFKILTIENQKVLLAELSVSYQFLFVRFSLIHNDENSLLKIANLQLTH